MPDRATVAREAAHRTCAVCRSNGSLWWHIPRALAGESVHIVRPSWLLVFASAWLPPTGCSGHGRPLWLRARASGRNDRSIAAIAGRPLGEHRFARRPSARTRLGHRQRWKVPLPDVRHRRNGQGPSKVRQRAIVTRQRQARAIHRQASGGVRRWRSGRDAETLEGPGRRRGPVRVIRRESVPVACRGHPVSTHDKHQHTSNHAAATHNQLQRVRGRSPATRDQHQQHSAGATTEQRAPPAAPAPPTVPVREPHPPTGVTVPRPHRPAVSLESS